MSPHNQRLEDAKNAANTLFSDTSVALSETRASLRDPQEHVEYLIDAVKRSIKDERTEE